MSNVPGQPQATGPVEPASPVPGPSPSTDLGLQSTPFHEVSQAVPASGPAATQTVPRNRAIVTGVVAAIATVVLVAAGIAAGAFFLGGDETAPVAAEQWQSPDAVQVVDDGSTQSDLEPVAAPAVPNGQSAATQAPAVPPPVPQNQSVQSVTIRSESGNLICRYHMVDESSPGVVCQQPNVNYALPSAACKAGASGMVIGLTASGTMYPCLAENIKGGETLRFDTPYTHAGVTCTINYTTGLTCKNSKGRGFTMEYDAGVSTF